MSMFLFISLLGLVFFGTSALLGHHGIDGGSLDSDQGGSGLGHGETALISDLLNLRNLFLFITGFGSAGAVAEYFGASSMISNLCGFVGGLFLVSLIVVVYYFVRKQDSNTVFDGLDLVGKTGFITTAIPKDGLGEIAVSDNNGLSHHFIARSDSPIDSGSVLVKSISNNTATVVAIKQ